MKSSTTAIYLAIVRSSTYNRACAFLYTLVITCYLVGKIGHLTFLGPVLSTLSVLAILISLPNSGWGTRILTALFIGAGTILLYRKGVPWPQYLGAYGEMVYLLALMAVVPFLSIPIKLGDYGGAIQAVLRRRISSAFGLNCLATTIAFVCGSFMSIAAVPIMIASMGPVVGSYPLRDPLRFMTVSATYSCMLPILWAPVSSVLGLVLHLLHLDWLSLFPLLFSLSIAALCSNWAIFYLLELLGRKQSTPIEMQLDQPSADIPISRLLQMLLGIVLLMISIVVMESWLRLGIATIVALVCVPFALAWGAALGKTRQFLKSSARHLTPTLSRMSDQFAIFLSAGFFVKAMYLSGVDHSVNVLFLNLHDAVGTQWLLILMPFIAVMASFLGVHPLVAIALLGESLKPEVLGINPTPLAITLIGSSALTYMLGPFSGTLALVQSVSHVSTLRLSLWNAPYAAGYFVILVVVVLYFT